MTPPPALGVGNWVCFADMFFFSDTPGSSNEESCRKLRKGDGTPKSDKECIKLEES